MIKKLYTILKNKYVICTIIFLILSFFIDDNNFMTSFSLKKKKLDMEKEKYVLVETITKDSINTQKFKNDLSECEKYGREHYYMKRTNEDIFIMSRSN